MKTCKTPETNSPSLASNSGRAKMIVLLMLAAAASWYWNHRPAPRIDQKQPSTQSPAPAPPQSSAPAQQEPAYENAQDYARKYVAFAGVTEGMLNKPGLILRFDNRGDRDISNLSVKIIGYKEFYVMDMSKATGTEYSVDLEVKSFPAKKVTETVLYFPPGVLSISRSITVDNASF